MSHYGPKECLSKQKRYLRYKMIKPCRLTMRQYVGLVCDLNSRMAQLPPLFEDSQMPDDSGLVDSLANKAPISHKAMLISQGFNPETANLETFVEHCKHAETTNDISGAKFPASNEDNKPRKKKRTKSKDDHGKKRKKRSTKMYYSLHGDNNSHTSQESNVLKCKGKEKPKLSKKDFKKKSRDINLLEKKASQQKAKYLKYKSLNNASSMKKTPVILEDSKSDSSSSKEENSYDEGEENSMTYDLESGGIDKSSDNATNTE